MLPQMLHDYKSLKEDFVKAELGIIDSNTEPYTAMCVSDCYFGAGGSLIPVYSALEKPMMVTDYKYPNGISEKQISLDQLAASSGSRAYYNEKNVNSMELFLENLPFLENLQKKRVNLTVHNTGNQSGKAGKRIHGIVQNILPDDEKCYYEDEHGNRIIGNANGAEITFLGSNSLVQIGDSCKLKDVSIRVEDGAQCFIGDETVCRGTNVWLHKNSLWKCGSKCTFVSGGWWNLEENNINIFDGVRCTIGDLCYFQYGLTISVQKGSLTIGDESIFGHDVEMRSCDEHSIFDVVSGENINSTPEINSARKIDIGNHVWVGARAFILCNTVIKDGAVIGAKSLVAGYVPNNSIAAGNPARVIRKNIAWSTEIGADNIKDCGEKYINLTDTEA
jgi:acetyltransferase-like isoleucine patch superfamily enzyme